MECEIAITRICTILDQLSADIAKLIENSDKPSNITEKEHENSLKAARHFLHMLNRLRCLVEKRMRTSPAEERERAFNLASALVNGKKAQAEVENLLDSIESQRKEYESCINDLEAKIAEEEKQIEEMKRNHEKEIAKIKDRSKRIQEKIIAETREDEERLKTEIDLKKAELENIRCTRAKDERELYAKRKKVEQEYLEILAMYDTNVGGLYRTMESLIEESNLLDTNLRICQEKLIVQETEYEMLKSERESEILRIFTENLNEFRRKRAAKIIQIAWRKYLERLLLRKKKKSKKKK